MQPPMPLSDQLLALRKAAELMDEVIALADPTYAAGILRGEVFIWHYSRAKAHVLLRALDTKENQALSGAHHDRTLLESWKILLMVYDTGEMTQSDAVYPFVHPYVDAMRKGVAQLEKSV